MTPEQKLAFVHKMTRLGLSDLPRHYDEGGTVLAGPISSGGGQYQDFNQRLEDELTRRYKEVPLAFRDPDEARWRQTYRSEFENKLKEQDQKSAPDVPLIPGTNLAQLNQAYQGAQQGLNAAQNLTSQLAPGIQQGITSQDYLTNALMNQSQGLGPNPAQAAFNAQTGQNIAQQAALAARTRGAGANAGLLASQNAQLGAGVQQQAVGQNAYNQAIQQLNAQSALGNLAGNQISQGAGAVQFQNQAAQAEQGLLQQAIANQNQNLVSSRNALLGAQAAKAQADAQREAGIFGGIGQAIGGLGGGIIALSKKAEGGVIGGPSAFNSFGAAKIGSVPLQPLGQAYGGNVQDHLVEGGQVPGHPLVNRDDYANDTVDAKLSPGELVIPISIMNDSGELGQMARYLSKAIELQKQAR